MRPYDDASVPIDCDDDDDDRHHEDQRSRQRVRQLAEEVVLVAEGPVLAQSVGGREGDGGGQGEVGHRQIEDQQVPRCSHLKIINIIDRISDLSEL